MKTVYLHIGAGKTGTTSIQRCLSKCSEFLLKSDVQYIQSGGGFEGIGHQNFAKSFIANPPSYMILPDCDGSRKSIKEEISSSSKNIFVLSSENFMLADPSEVKKFFDGVDGDISCKVILFVRSQDELAESEYNQMVKVRSERRSFFEYAEKEFNGDFYSLAESWSNVFGVESMICRVFDARNSFAEKDFFCCLPIADVDYYRAFSGQVEVKNASLGHVALTVKRMINRLPEASLGSKHFQLPREITDFLRTYDIPSVHMDSEQADSFRSKYADINRKFCEVYLGESRSDIGGLRYTYSERDELYNQCRSIGELL